MAPDVSYMCLQLLGTGVTLHMACPGFVDTPMIREAQKAAVRASSLTSKQATPVFSPFGCACAER